MGSLGGSRGGSRGTRSWLLVSLLGVLVLLVPLYDIWEDLTRLSWHVPSTLIENTPLILLAVGLVLGGVWLGRQDWDPEYVRLAATWSVGITVGIAALYGAVIAWQLWAMNELKPWVLALDGILFGAVAAFGVGVYNARQKRVEDELERSHEAYRTLTDDVLDTSDVATFVLDESFQVAWANQAAKEYFGLDRELQGADKRRLIETHIADIVDEPADFQARALATYRDNDSTEEFECHIPAAEDRPERWLEHWSQPIESGRYEGGRIEHYTEITERKRSKQELKLREQTLHEMHEVISDSGSTFEGKVADLLAIGRERLGAEHGSLARIDDGEYHVEILRSELDGIEAGDVLPLSETGCQRTVERGRTTEFDTGSLDSAGVAGDGYGTGRYVGTPVYEGETLYGTLCFLGGDAPFDDWELTLVELMGNWVGYELERKHLLQDHQQRRREAESKFEDIVASVDNYAIFTLDSDGYITSWNAGAQRIKGYTEGEIVGERLTVFYPDDAVESGLPETLLAEAKATGMARDEGWRVRKDGSKFWADVTIAARYDGGDHVGYTKVVRDMTDQREYERTIEHERERLEFMNRIIRHNILNGLNLIRARSRIVESSVAGGDAEQHLETIQARVEDMTSLVQTMRTFTDAIVSDADHETEPVPLRPALDRKIELVRDSYPDAEFDTHDLPPDSLEITGDELVGEIIENVLSNAVVHNDAETPRVEVWTTRTTLDSPDGALPGGAARPSTVDGEPRRAIEVHVADNGPGIPDDQKEAVLQKGVSELRTPGNGFGLYLVREMIQAYGGRIDIDDADGGGTVVTMAFPLAE